MSKLFVSAALLLSLLSASAQTSGPHKKTSAAASAHTGNLPTHAEVDAALKRTLGYDPAITWKVIYISPSDAPGISQVLVQFNNQDYQTFYVLPAGQLAIRGEMIPFGSNPFADNRKKLQAADGPARGPAQPVISIVEFSDLQCPHCKVAHPTVEKLIADFPQVRFVFQNFPLPMHSWAMKAAEYADCAAAQNPSAFWKYVADIFENQGSIADATADEKLKELAGTAGLDPEKLSACAAAPATEARVKKSLALGKSLGVQGTPTVFINGRSLPGLGGLDYDHLKELVLFETQHAGK